MCVQILVHKHTHIRIMGWISRCLIFIKIADNLNIHIICILCSIQIEIRMISRNILFTNINLYFLFTDFLELFIIMSLITENQQKPIRFEKRNF